MGFLKPSMKLRSCPSSKVAPCRATVSKGTWKKTQISMHCKNIDRNQDETCDMAWQPSVALKSLPRKRPQDVHVCGFQQSVATCSHRSGFLPQDGGNTLPSLPPLQLRFLYRQFGDAYAVTNATW